MEFVGFGLAIVAIAAAVYLFVRSRAEAQAAAERHSALEAEFATSKREAEEAAAAASATQESLEAELEAAIARRDQKAVAAALWNLELERSHRQWLEVIVPAHSDRSVDSVTAGEQLTFAVAQEVERLREEVGVAIRFDGAFDLDLEPENALGALRLTEELLAIAAKVSDEVSVSLDQLDPTSEDDDELDAELSIEVLCAGWDEEEGTAEALTEELRETAERLDGKLVWEEIEDDSIRATLRLPAPLVERAVSTESSGV